MATSTDILPFNFSPIDDASPVPRTPSNHPSGAKGSGGGAGSGDSRKGGGPDSAGSQFSDWDAETPSPLKRREGHNSAGSGSRKHDQHAGTGGNDCGRGSGEGGSGGAHPKASSADDSLELSGFESMSSTELFGRKRAADPHLMTTPTPSRREDSTSGGGRGASSSAGDRSVAESSQFSDWDADMPSPVNASGAGGAQRERGSSLVAVPTPVRTRSPASVSTGARTWGVAGVGSGSETTSGDGATPHTTEPMHTVSTSVTSGVVSAFGVSSESASTSASASASASASSGGASAEPDAYGAATTPASTTGQPQESAPQPHVYPHRPRPPPRQLKRGRSCPKTKFAHTPKSKSVYTFAKEDSSSFESGAETKDSKENRNIDMNANASMQRTLKPNRSIDGANDSGVSVGGGGGDGGGGGGSGGGGGGDSSGGKGGAGSATSPLVIPSPRTKTESEAGSGPRSGISDPLASPSRSSPGSKDTLDLELSSDLDLDVDLFSKPKPNPDGTGNGNGNSNSNGGGDHGDRGGSDRHRAGTKAQATPTASPRGPRTSGFDQPSSHAASAPAPAPAPAPVESYLDSDSGDWDEDDPLEASMSLGAGGGVVNSGDVDQRSPARTGRAGVGGSGATAARSPATTSSPVKKGGPKCKQAYLAGGGAPLGHGSAFNKFACPNMRCTNCDFTVMRIDGMRWKDELDYLFLRNHVPFLDKLQPMLEDDPSNCAYACQCSSKNVNEFLSLKKVCASSNLRWVCAGH